MFSMTLVKILSLLTLMLVPMFADYVQMVYFVQQPDFKKTNIPKSIILDTKDVEFNYRCLEYCKKNETCLSVLIRDSKCFLLDTYCSTDGPVADQEAKIPKIEHYRVPTICQPGWYSGGASCYKVSASKTFPEAVTDCNNQDASVVTVEHAEENALLKQMLTDINESVDEFYIGINDCGHPNQFTYATHNRNKLAPFLDWYENNRGRGQECCVVMNKHYNYSWSLSPCEEASPTSLRGAICEMKSLRK